MNETILEKYLDENTLINLTDFKAINNHQPEWLQCFDCGKDRKYVIIIWPDDCNGEPVVNDIISYYAFTHWVEIAIDHWNGSKYKRDITYEKAINEQNIIESIILYCIKHINEKEFSGIFEILENIIYDLQEQGKLDEISTEAFIIEFTNSVSALEGAKVLKNFLHDNEINLNLMFSSIINNNLDKLYRNIQISDKDTPNIPWMILYDQIPIENMFSYEIYRLIDDNGINYNGVIYCCTM